MDVFVKGAKLRTIPISLLRPGMYIHDLKCSWLKHSFWQRRFLVENNEIIERLQNDKSIKEIVIDLSRGSDVTPEDCSPNLESHPDSTALDEQYRHAVEKQIEQHRKSLSIDDARARMRFVRQESMSVIRDLMGDIRIGQPVNIRRAEPVIDKILDSVIDHQDALIPLLRLKDIEQCVFQHSVSVAALSLALGLTIGIDKPTLRQIGLGALLHDLGKALTPEQILNKPGRLTEDEMVKMREHVVDTHRILTNTNGISSITFESAVYHHERLNGSGYPFGDSLNNPTNERGLS